MSDDVVPDHVRRALLYLVMLNSNGAEPAAVELDAFAVSDPPVRVSSLSAAFTNPFFETRLLPVSGYMFRLGWITLGSANGLRLTRLGFALAKAFDNGSGTTSKSGPDTAVLDLADAVLEPGDPEAFERFTRVVAEAGIAMLADPYFKASTIGWVLTSTKINRVLVSKKGAISKGEEGIIAARLAAPDLAGRIEIRVCDAPEYHDRAVLGEKGDVWLLGTSLNGVGRHLSILSRLDRECWPVYRHRLEKLWHDSRAITPQPIVESTTALASEPTGQAADPTS